MRNSFHKLGQFAIIAMLVVGVAFPALSSLSCARSGYSGAVESITIGAMANAGDTLLFTAEEQKYFAAHGLNVTLKTYVNGLAATDAMLKGEADLAYATEFVVVGKALQKQDISIITSYSKNETVSLAGRKDRGIDSVLALKGKKVGLARGTINEFYLGRLLNLNKLGIQDVTLIEVKLTELEDAISSGKVDAVVAGSRNLYPVIQKQGSNVFLMPIHSGQPASGTLVGKREWVKSNDESTKRLLKALVEAEQYVNRNPDKAKAAVQKRLNYDDEYMAGVWAEYQFSVSLDQSLIAAMEDQARWMISNNLTVEKQVPDFMNYIYEDALKAVKPSAVNIMR